MTENREKQIIEEMALAICESRGVADVDNCRKCRQHESCLYQDIAFGLYKAGYRKQSEGEWTFNLDGSGTCSVCHFTQRGVWDYDSHQRYCGVCGAKMKGGAE